MVSKFAKKAWWDDDQFDPCREEHNIKVKRVWHHYKKWEDAANGMYRSIGGEERKSMLEQAIEFTGNDGLYGKFMRMVVVEWPIACEHNLTALEINRKTWIGHAACCLATGIPEDITREAWGRLSSNQRKRANRQADLSIKQWENMYYWGKNAKDNFRSKCSGSCSGTDRDNLRYVQQSIFELLGWQGQHGNASSGC